MRDTVWRRIVSYLIFWGLSFLVICIVSIIKNWSELVDVMEQAFAVWISHFAIIGILIYGIISLIRGAFRR